MIEQMTKKERVSLALACDPVPLAFIWSLSQVCEVLLLSLAFFEGEGGIHMWPITAAAGRGVYGFSEAA